MAEPTTSPRNAPETQFQKTARWIFWIAFLAITTGALVWVRFGGS